MSENEDPNKGETSLLDLDSLLKNKGNNESLAVLAIRTLEPHLAELKPEGRIFGMGKHKVKGGKFNGGLRSLGKLAVKEMSMVKSITNMGKMTIGDLIVVENKTSLYGKSTIKGNAILAGKTIINGKSTFHENVIVSKSLTVYGKLVVHKQIITDAPIWIGGKLAVEKIQSLSKIFVRGNISVKHMLKAEKFLLTGGTGGIGDDLIAREVGIGRNKKLKRYLRNYENDRNLNNPVDLFKYIGNLVISPIVDIRKGKKPFRIKGDVIGDDIFLENTIVEGNINAKRIIIGNNVIVKGEIEFSESFESLTGEDYQILKIGKSDLLYLNDPDDEFSGKQVE